MKIIDSCITCADYEKDLLWLKVHLEHSKVDEFIFIQNRYDYHGRDKGYWLSTSISDARFDPYREKIKIISLDQKFSDPSQESKIDPQDYANAEWALRDASHEYLVNKYEDGDMVFSSDVDEIVDFSDEQRSARMIAELSKGGPIQFDRVRYIYDFDNIAPRSKFDMITPAFSIANLKNGQAKLRDKKWVGRQVENGKRPMIFEYCHVFTYEGYIQKHMSSLHTQWSIPKLDLALQTNSWPKTAYQGYPDLNCRWDWFEKIELNEDNSPQFIREGLDLWGLTHTNLVPENYKDIREIVFGRNPSFIANGDGNYDV